jgi:steroid delta-isomerase-like uncharacterized protein
VKNASRLAILALPLLVIAVSAGCQPQATEPAAPAVDLAALEAAVTAAWNDKDVDQYDTFSAPGLKIHQVGAQMEIEGLDAVKEWIRAVHVAFPDMQWRADDIFAAGDRVVLLWSWNGTHLGPLPGPPDVDPLPATGNSVGNSGVAILYLVDGKVTETWSYFDMAFQQQQLGYTITPPTEFME